MNIVIRSAKPDDLIRIAGMTKDLTVHHCAFQWSVQNHLKHVERRFSNSRYIHIVALVNERIIGFTGAELKSTKTAYMLKGFVEPDFRRKGIMCKLEKHLEKILKQRGITKLDLKVNSSNKELTWSALGFKTIQQTMRKQL
jgi:ribosomal protein S18 acetylase RimI-like enzyme